MKKKDFVTLLMSTAGGILFALGMCIVMAWNMMIPGIVAGIIGIVLLICLIPICRGLK